MNVSFSIDRGGTFTDIFSQIYTSKSAVPKLHVLKLLSVDPLQKYLDAPREGIRRVLLEITGDQTLYGEAASQLLPTKHIKSIRMGTTVATNALLERRGTPCLFVATRGMSGEALAIGHQTRQFLFDLKARKVEPLFQECLEINERVLVYRTEESVWQGNANDELSSYQQAKTGEYFRIEKQLDKGQVKRDLQSFYEKGYRSLAICLMHATLVPDHELEIEKLAKEIGFPFVAVSHRIMPISKWVLRATSTCCDAYLTPVLKEYIESFLSGFENDLKGVPVHFMQSDGGLTPVESFTGLRSLLSGPAGGVLGYAHTIQKSVAPRAVIGFDMGGTSTDVSRFDGQHHLVDEAVTAGVVMAVPQRDVHTVAAGGGSILSYRNGLLHAGPESAGARPGPACYGFNGPATVTDANLLLGRLVLDKFPHCFGPDQRQALKVSASEAAFQPILELIQQTDPTMNLDTLAEGFIAIAEAEMIRAAASLTLGRGVDASQDILASFGGAGGQHACAVARGLGVPRVIVHRYASLLSAVGLATAAQECTQMAPIQMPLTSQVWLNVVLPKLLVLMEASLRGLSVADIYVHCRFQDTSTASMLFLGTFSEMDALQNLFHSNSSLETLKQDYFKKHLQLFGFVPREQPIILESVRVRARSTSDSNDLLSLCFSESSDTSEPTNGRMEPFKYQSCYFSELGRIQTPVYDWDALPSELRFSGPCLIVDNNATVVVLPGASVKKSQSGDLVIDVSDSTANVTLGSTDSLAMSNPSTVVQLTLFANRFMSIAESMGRTLEHTAVSTNIRDRRDFSCALFAPNGDLIANAPHIPVHLGSMTEAIRYQLQLYEEHLKPGNVVLTNHPRAGGSHLPDMTVITPVYDEKETLLFFVASRAHHADVGGITPGSMPPHSKWLSEEGVAIESFKLCENGQFQTEALKSLMKGTRRWSDNLHDFKAQVAANQRGVDLILALIREQSITVVHRFMRLVTLNAERAVRDMLKRYCDTSSSVVLKASDAMDDGSEILLCVTLDGKTGNAHFDFSGSSPQVYGNWNAPRAICASAVMYCLRCLVQDPIPLNQGCLKAVTLTIPDKSLLCPDAEAAVIGGNVTTSQRVVDVILRAFKVCAASHGCMNNLTFGDSSFGYYETMGGGAGAGPDWHGTSGVHTHMTNTRMTDAEILERRYPVIVRRFALRPHSGGSGRFQGGRGLVRHLEWTRPVQVSLLTERRVLAPFGMAGGEPGQKGRNIWWRFINDTLYPVHVGGKNSFMVKPGEQLVIETPGGGGFGHC